MKMSQYLKELTEGSFDHSSDSYREEGYQFFNGNILKLASDENIPLLERINYINIVFKNELEHYGRLAPNLFAPERYIMLTDTIERLGMITRAFESIKFDYTKLSNLQLEMPELSSEQTSEDDIPILVYNDVIQIMYMKKSDANSLIMDGNFYVPLNRIHDLTIQYEIPEVGTWSDKYIEKRIGQMSHALLPEVIVWISNSTPDKTKKSIWKYFLDRQMYPIFMNVDLWNLIHYKPSESEKDLQYEPITQKRVHNDYLSRHNFCDVFRLPYDSFDNVLDLYDQAVHSDEVESIYITIYRTKLNMRLIDTLIEGTHLGKTLNIYIELRSRGDEENNYNLVKRLKAECDPNHLNIYTSLKGYKVHAKLGLIKMKDGHLICHCGTGNLNEVTAKLYKDTHIITDDIETCKSAVSTLYAISSKDVKYRINLKDILREEISKESQRGSAGRIILKCNHIADDEIINLLYQAKKRGCEVILLPRTTFGYPDSMFGKKKFRGGRFLEHERIYIFGNDDTARVYMSSSDILFRNLYGRVEFTFKLPYDVNPEEFIKECY